MDNHVSIHEKRGDRPVLLSSMENRFYAETDCERKIPASPRGDGDLRDPFERDYGRIIHSAAFRRLQSKTQVIGTEVGDFHRTRLTHSLEVAQVARGIVLSLNRKAGCWEEEERIDTSLVEAAALAHDLGHPPFGHEGERALNKCMQFFGGFESNAHTFRILTRLEGKEGEGLNLTRALLLSVMKYPVTYGEAVNMRRYDQKDFHPPKASVFDSDRDAFQWVLQPFSGEERDFYLDKRIPDPNSADHAETKGMSLECSIIEIADDIAYATHDLEDALNLKLVDLEELQELLADGDWRQTYEEIAGAAEIVRGLDRRHSDFHYQLKQVFADLISAFVNHVSVHKQGGGIRSNRLRYRAFLPEDLKELNRRLKKIADERVIRSPQVRALSWKGGRIVERLFEAFCDEPDLLPEKVRRKAKETPRELPRIVCDHIAGMTDPYALKMHHRLFGAGGFRIDP